jgi:uncharacterized membrane protein
MLRYFIQVVQTSLGTAVLTALLFALVYKGGGKTALGAGCVAASAASLVVAALRRTTALINRGFFNTLALSLAIAAGIVFIALYWRKHKRALNYAGGVLAAALLFYILPTLFLYPTEFLLAGESVFSTDFLFKLIGYSAGIALVLLTGLAVFKTGMALPEQFVGIVLTLGLAVNMVNQAAGIIQFLFARRIIPMVRWLFRIIVVLINNNTVFLSIAMVIGCILPVILFALSFHPIKKYTNPAEHRKIRAAQRRSRRWSAAVTAGLVVSLLTLTALKTHTERGVVLSPAEPMTITGGEITIPIEQISDGHLHRFAYTAEDSTEVRFIVIRKNEIAYGVGLDACDICGATGYYERKNQVICRLCDVVMNVSTIGFKGGCNPVPLAYTLRGGTMAVQTGDLENERGRFK